MKSNQIPDFVEQYVEHQQSAAALDQKVKDAGYDPAALKRAANWTEAKELRQQQRAAIQRQNNYRAGRVSEPAVIPVGTELARVAELGGHEKSVREIAKEMGIAKSKVGRLMRDVALFGVRVPVPENGDSPADDPEKSKPKRGGRQ